jgi:hypothetical protein
MGLNMIDETMVCLERLEEQLSFYAEGECKPMASGLLSQFLSNLYDLQDDRDKLEAELRTIERKMSREIDEGRVGQLNDTKKDKVLSLDRMSASMFKLNQQISTERASLLRRAEAHFPELLVDPTWPKQVGITAALFEDAFGLARSGLWLSGTHFSDFQVELTLRPDAVYLVRDREGKKRILKRFPLGDANDASHRRFARQVERLKGLCNGHVVAVLGVFIDK